MTSTRRLGQRLGRAIKQQQGKGTFAIVGYGDGVTVDVPDTTNQIYLRINNDINQTHPAYNLTGITFAYDDKVWCELRRGEYWVTGEYTFTV